MKKLLCALLASALLCGCAAGPAETTAPVQTTAPALTDAVALRLSDGGVEFPADSGVSVTDGDGSTVVRITEPGTYVLTGTLSAGQIAVDLGEDAKEDPNAVVTLILDNADITCSEAPAVIFYNVYECGQPDGPAGANVILAEGSANRIIGSHTEDYDGALYSRMSMTVGGGGSLFIDGDNEGLCSEKHLTVGGGFLRIESGNDGINANEDGVSVVTVNGGTVDITVTGETGEGDGIDSNGWLIINGGVVRASAYGISGDAGIDSDMGIRINGGVVCAGGNMLDRIEDGGQTHIVFTFAGRQEPGVYTLKNAKGETVAEYTASNAFQYLILSSPELTEGTYTLWSGKQQYQGMAGGMMGGFMEGAEIQRPDWPEDGADVEIPPQPTMPIVTQGTVQPPAGEQPENMPVPPMPEGDTDMPTPPIPEGSENMPMPQPPAGMEPPPGGRQPGQFVIGTLSPEFPVKNGANYFMSVCPVE